MNAVHHATLLQSELQSQHQQRNTNTNLRVANWKFNGRAADIFSLGCVLIEILCLHRRGSLDQIRKNRSADPSFHANIDKLASWLCNGDDKFSRQVYYLEGEIRLMLAKDPADRPTALELLSSIAFYDANRHDVSSPSMFGSCCKEKCLPFKEHTAAIAELREKNKKLEKDNERRYKSTVQAHLASLTEIRKTHKTEMYHLQRRFLEDVHKSANAHEEELKYLRAESEDWRVALEGLKEKKGNLRRRSHKPRTKEKTADAEAKKANAAERANDDSERLRKLEREAARADFSRLSLASLPPYSNNPPLETERPQFAARWPSTSFSAGRVEVDHDDQHSSSYAESSWSVNRSTDAVPKPSKDSLYGFIRSSALSRNPYIPYIGSQMLPPAGMKVSDFVEDILRRHGEDDVSDDDEEPA